MLEVNDFVLRVLLPRFEKKMKLKVLAQLEGDTANIWNYVIQIDYEGLSLFRRLMVLDGVGYTLDNMVREIQSEIDSFERLSKRPFDYTHMDFILDGLQNKFIKESRCHKVAEKIETFNSKSIKYIRNMVRLNSSNGDFELIYSQCLKADGFKEILAV